MDSKQKMSYDAGVAKGQTQEKASTMMDKAGGAAQAAMGTMQSAGQTVQKSAAGAVETVKKATGITK
ncbi:uncharacterized protein LOC126797824 [Argentina anserina]|uniref:uncharacterized protein LOC126797824 n=1 Tax=Argentina anserina TaxID=57926 RepID=UPI00217639F8|nr:uncharacterized protein LOC126797824 [Potentilla anserina]